MGKKKQKPEATAAKADKIASNIVEGAAGTVRMFAPKGTGAVGVHGEDGKHYQFRARDDGSLVVPRVCIGALRNHGFQFEPFKEK